MVIVKEFFQSRQQRSSLRILLPTFFLMSLLGCATMHDTPLPPVVPLAVAQPYSVGILPPRIDDRLLPKNVGKTDTNFFIQFFFAGKGSVAATATMEEDISLALVSNLSISNQFETAFRVKDEEEARYYHLSHVLICKAHDYRTLIAGPNLRFIFPFIFQPIDYFVRARTLDASIDWEVELRSLETGEVVFHRRLPKHYFMSVRYAFPKHFNPKMVRFLQDMVTPVYIYEIFNPPTQKIPQ